MKVFLRNAAKGAKESAELQELLEALREEVFLRRQESAEQKGPVAPAGDPLHRPAGQAPSGAPPRDPLDRRTAAHPGSAAHRAPLAHRSSPRIGPLLSATLTS